MPYAILRFQKRKAGGVAGQRRVRASGLAGIDTVPAFVLPLGTVKK